MFTESILLIVRNEIDFPIANQTDSNLVRIETSFCVGSGFRLTLSTAPTIIKFRDIFSGISALYDMGVGRTINAALPQMIRTFHDSI